MPKFANAINLQQNELQNARLHMVAGTPGSPVEGQIYWNSTGGVKHAFVYSGSAWIQLDGVLSHTHPESDITGLVADITYLNSHVGTLESQIVDKQPLNDQLTYIAGMGPGIMTYCNDGGIVGRSLAVGSGLTIVDEAGDMGNPTIGIDSTVVALKSYVDGVVQGLDVKASCIVATTGNISLTSGPTLIDGIGINAEGKRVLVKDQSDLKQNGIYTVHMVSTTVTFVRAPDADTNTEVTGAFTFIEDGTVNRNTGWVLEPNSTSALGVCDVNVVRFSGAGEITVGNGISKSGDLLDARCASDWGIKLFGGGLGLFLADDSLYVDASGVRVNNPFHKNYANNSSTANPWVFAHGMGNANLTVTLTEVSTGAVVFADIVIDSTNVTSTFAVAPTTGQYHITVMG